MKKIFLHNICGYGYCKTEICFGCSHIKLYLVVGRKEYELPKIINKILKLFWGK